jgi:DNA-3-methyladenine glycosylase
VLSPSFYLQDTALVARALLGALLECRTADGVTCGRIVETEAYLGPGDPASHAVPGLTARNRCLFGPPGTAYVYFIYGMHWCVNAVAGAHGSGNAVLIRALEPIAGVALMHARRGDVNPRDLTNGPGKLCDALGIDRRLDGTRLDRGPLRILRGDRTSDERVRVTPRIGIRKAADWPLRYVVEDSPYISRAPATPMLPGGRGRER